MILVRVVKLEVKLLVWQMKPQPQTELLVMLELN